MYLLVVTVIIATVLDSSNSQLISVRVHGWQNVDAGGVDESLDAFITKQILRAEVLSQVDEQLTT